MNDELSTLTMRLLGDPATEKRVQAPVKKIAFVASKSPEGQAALTAMQDLYGNVKPAEAEVIVALGGDGFMLQTLHRNRQHGKPVFGMKAGTVGFMMNLYRPDGLLERLEVAQPTVLRPLVMVATAESGNTTELLAFNEVSLLRQTKQAAKIRVYLNGAVKLDELVCDGVLLATPAGAEVLALTPIAAFRPRRWRGAIIRSNIEVRFEILDHYKRPVSATADASEVRDVIEVQIRESIEQTMTLLFDPEHSLEERILNEQFAL